MQTLRSHTHLQAAQGDTQTKAYKRVCLPNRTDRQKALVVTAALRYGGRSANINSCATNELWWVKTI
ncbi:MAG: hypothetical protein HND27_10935 [Bacteroidetes bacterium]|nr:hypothetical protein [Bacteroidota bacterium]